MCKWSNKLGDTVLCDKFISGSHTAVVLFNMAPIEKLLSVDEML